VGALLREAGYPRVSTMNQSPEVRTLNTLAGWRCKARLIAMVSTLLTRSQKYGPTFSRKRPSIRPGLATVADTINIASNKIYDVVIAPLTSASGAGHRIPPGPRRSHLRARYRRRDVRLAACNKVSVEAFKKPMKDLDRAVYKLPFHRGEEKEYAGYGPGVVYVTMSAKNIEPTVVGRDLTTPFGPEEFYAGCYARASVTPFAFNNIGKGIALGLNHLQKLKEREHSTSLDPSRTMRPAP
jgi:hypothetical protein